jgi:pimeloyl-ACP methyl ester carboxylesterase
MFTARGSPVSEYDSYRVLAGRVRMHVLDWPGNGPPVLFVHHFSANALAALRLGNLLVHRRRVIAPDLRGRGDTDMPFGEYGLQVHVKDVIACLDRLGVERFVASGHSMGAAIAVFLAAQFPDRVAGLMLFDGGAVPGEMAIQVLNAYYDALQYRYPSLEAYVDRYREAPTYQPWTAELEALVRSNLYQQPDGSFMRRVPRYVIDADRRAEDLETWRQLPQLYTCVRCPVLILRAGMGLIGKEDRVLPDEVVATMLDGMPAARVVTVDAAGHTSLLTIPSMDRDAAILEFLGVQVRSEDF